MKSRPVVYPFLLAAFPIVRLAAQNAREVSPGDLAEPLGIALAATAACWIVARWATRDGHRAGLIVAVAAVMVLMFDVTCAGFNDVAARLTTFWIQTWIGYTPPWAVLMVDAIVLASLAWLVSRRTAEASGRWTPRLNVFAAILLILPAGEAATTWLRPSPAKASAATPPLAALDATRRRPDIYYIVLDGFARADILKEEFGYDLEPFLRRLESKGFFVARRATSNYCQTFLSLSSSLNGMYLPKSDEDAWTSFAKIRDRPLFRYNAALRSLRPLGYRYVTFGSGFDFTEFPQNDFYYSPYRHLGNFHRLIVDATPARLLWPDPSTRDQFTMLRERTFHLFDRLPEVARIAGPTFTVAHVLSPHPPFVFGADGEDVSPRSKVFALCDGDSFRHFYGGEEAYIPGYRAQVDFLVKRTERAIDAILANSPEPPIIVLQSDHGSGLHLDTESAAKTDHRERMSILSAFYLPGGKREGLTDTITPVNAFRVVFNNEFGTSLPLLPEESYYSTWPRPFNFIRVTDQVRGGPPPMACDPPPRDAPGPKSGGL